jgi:putative ABC transport system ATP-binding protein
MSDQIMLKVERLTKTYPAATGPLTVLREVTFQVDAGSTLAVVGPSRSHSMARNSAA